MVEHLTVNQGVAGSSPARGAIFFSTPSRAPTTQTCCVGPASGVQWTQHSRPSTGGKIVVDDLAGDAGRPLGSQGDPQPHRPDPASQPLKDDALRVAATKYKVLFDSFPLGITISDETGTILESNKEAERLLGLGREEQARRQIDGAEWRIIRPDGRPMPSDEYASVRALRENRLIENVEMGIAGAPDDVTWISVTAQPLPLEGHGVVITYGDITARRKAERDYQTLFHEMLDGFALHEIAVWLHGQCDRSPGGAGRRRALHPETVLGQGARRQSAGSPQRGLTG
jgi:PAS domain S-box-containing protein